MLKDIFRAVQVLATLAVLGFAAAHAPQSVYDRRHAGGVVGGSILALIIIWGVPYLLSYLGISISSLNI